MVNSTVQGGIREASGICMYVCVVVVGGQLSLIFVCGCRKKDLRDGWDI